MNGVVLRTNLGATIVSYLEKIPKKFLNKSVEYASKNVYEESNILGMINCLQNITVISSQAMNITHDIKTTTSFPLRRNLNVNDELVFWDQFFILYQKLFFKNLDYLHNALL